MVNDSEGEAKVSLVAKDISVKNRDSLRMKWKLEILLKYNISNDYLLEISCCHATIPRDNVLQYCIYTITVIHDPLIIYPAYFFSILLVP